MRRFLSLFLTVLLLLSCLCTAFSLNATAAPDTKKRAIAIVFDNSGSMYSRTEAWCRATYAMEVFATMMNENDVMYIHPMHEIKVDGETYTSTEPLKITQKTATKIRGIITDYPGGTPIEAITDAYNDIQTKSADEKWLIVLTDGATFYKGDNELDEEETKEELETVLGEYVKSINTLYLGIGKAVDPEFSDPNEVYKSDHKVAENSADVLAYLSEMCNDIFGRDSLPSENIENGKITFDVSMSKLIVFIQGEKISDITLGGKKADDDKTYQMKYSEKGNNRYTGKDGEKIDTSLQGMLLTFEALDKGDYTLSYSGTATKVDVYYEPDVDLKVVLKDSDGNEVDPSGELRPDEYTVEYALVDNKGNITESKLLKTTDYSITYTKNGEKTPITDDKGGSFKITLDANDKFDSEFDVTYLDGYKIHRTGADFGWPFDGITILPPPIGNLRVELSGGASSYNITELETATPYRVKFFYKNDDLPNEIELTGELLDRVDVSATLTGGNIGCKGDKDSDGYYITIGEGASILDAIACDYTLAVSATYTDEYGQVSNRAEASKTFAVIDNSSQLTMTLTVEQDYYLIGDLENGKPIRVDLLLGSEKLTPEQVNEVELTWVADGISFRTEPLLDESAILIYIDHNNPPDDDSYEIPFTASIKNEIGRRVEDSKTAEFETRHWPLWARILIPILIILLIIALIVYFMTRKRLPKRLDFANCSFTVDGNKVPGKVRIDFPDGGKRRGSISITSPKYTANPLAKAGVRMEVEAVSPRYVRSSQRKICVLSSSPIPKPNVSSYKLGTASYSRDTGAPGVVFIKAGSAPNAKPKPFNIGNNSMLSVSAELMDGTSVTLSGNIKTL